MVRSRLLERLLVCLALLAGCAADPASHRDRDISQDGSADDDLDVDGSGDGDGSSGDGDAGDGDAQGDGDTGDGDAQGDGDTDDGDTQGDGDAGDGDVQGDGDPGDGDTPPPPPWQATCGVQSWRSATFYRAESSSTQLRAEIEAALPAMRQAGFDTVWLVLPWITYDPSPLATPRQYNEAEITALTQLLAYLSAEKFRAILPLNYLGVGWSPAGVDACTFISDAVTYQAFEEYVQHLLTALQPYAASTAVLFFTEGTEGCGPYDPVAHAARLRDTLGSLPARLPTNLRAAYRFGYHDYTLINTGQASGTSPLADPLSYDFLSMVAYGLEALSDDQIRTELDARAARFTTRYPTTPLIVGEFGASGGCFPGGSDAVQARVDGVISAWARDHGRGMNLWAWPACGSVECTPGYACGGLAITYADGSPRPAVAAVREALRPRVTSAGVTTSFNPWAVWVVAGNLHDEVEVELFDGGTPWGAALPVTLAPGCDWLSFGLPSNSPPSACNVGGSCAVQLRVRDVRSGLVSDFAELVLPAR